MIRPEPRAPNRDDLARQISFLKTDTMEKGAEALKMFLGMEKEGATPDEMFDETGRKFANPKTETGIFRGADSQPRYELTDEDMKIKPGINSFFHPTQGGETPALRADQLVDHPELFKRAPDVAAVQGRLYMPGEDLPGEKPWPGEGGYYEKQPRVPTGMFTARATSNVRDPNARNPGSLLNLTAHELGGHAVQDSHGFLRGDSPDNPEMFKAHQDLVHPRVMNYLDTLTDFKKSLGLSEEEFAAQYPEADDYLMAAGALSRPSRDDRMISALPRMQRYENVSGEEEGNMVSNRLGMSAEERRLGEDRPYKSNFMQQMPYEFQLLRSRTGDNYSMMDDKDKLARLMQRSPL